jgi:molybdate transport system permease protein
VACLAGSACGEPSRDEALHVAVAASLQPVMEELGREFLRAGGSEVVLAWGSSAKLAHQIENGAPFDVFAAADMSYIDRVIERGAALAHTRAAYARGRLVLWSRGALPRDLSELAAPRFARISLANPDHAPYGRAAAQALQRLGLWDTLAPRLVYGANVRQAMQYAATGDATVCFTALSLLAPTTAGGGGHVLIDPSLYDPLDQGMVVLSRSARAERAQAFIDFVRSAPGQRILTRRGFLAPPGPGAPDGAAPQLPREARPALAWAPLWLSLQVALAATVISLFLGVAVAALLSQRNFFGRELLDALVTMPLVLPPTVLGYYVLVALGQRSPVGRAYEAITGSTIVFTVSGAVVAATIGALPLVVKSARAALSSVDPTVMHAARTLGAGRVRAFFTVRLPLAAPGVIAALMLAFARSLGDFGVTLMVAGDIPKKTQTASLFIYDAIEAGREATAAGMIAVLSAVAIGVLYAVNRLTGGSRGW